MEKVFKIQGNDISDGYHTFGELYAHRIALFLALAKASGCPAYWKPDYQGWFCLYLELPQGQISYHLPNASLEAAQVFAKPVPEGYKWDGHTSNQVLERLLEFTQGLVPRGSEHSAASSEHKAPHP